MYFVYIIKCRKGYTYIGSTPNYVKRLKSHNSGENFATKPYKPFKLVAFFGFTSTSKAGLFEKYLKTGSGRAFINNRIL